MAQENERLSVEELHKTFLDALNGSVSAHTNLNIKPLEVDLKSPLPPMLRVYMYNATYPPGGRKMGEHKIQLIVPGQDRGGRGQGHQDIAADASLWKFRCLTRANSSYCGLSAGSSDIHAVGRRTAR